MNSTEIFQLASELTEQEVDNIFAGWENEEEGVKIDMFNSLVSLGDSRQLACATVIADAFNKNGASEMYSLAFQ